MAETQTLDQPRWWAKAVLIGGVLAAVLLPLAALGARVGLWEFTLGLLGLLVAAGLGAITLIVGLIAPIFGKPVGELGEKRNVVLGIVLGVLVTGVVLMQVNAGRSVPPIHNISTDTTNPPQFAEIVALRGDTSNPLEYNAAELAELQQQAYPWVTTLRLPMSAEQVFTASQTVIADMGLEPVSSNPATGVLEATATTFWFGFKDDMVVRITAEDGETLVDVRSVSRVGRSDLGANARRIGVFLDRLREAF